MTCESPLCPECDAHGIHYRVCSPQPQIALLIICIEPVSDLAPLTVQMVVIQSDIEEGAMSPKNRLMFLLAAALPLAAYTPAIARPPQPPVVRTSATMPSEVTPRADSESRMTTGAAPARPTPSDMNKTPGQQKLGRTKIQDLMSSATQAESVIQAVHRSAKDTLGGCAKC